MSSNASDIAPENRPVPDMAPTTSVLSREEADGQFSRVRWWLMLGGLAAGLVAFGVGEAIYDLIPAKDVQVDRIGHVSTGPSAETTNIAATQNGAFAYSVLGLCLGGFLGVAGGLARRSASSAVKAGLLGSVVAIPLAAGASLAVLPYFLKAIPNQPEYDLILSMIMHGSIWGLAGAAGGLAFAIGLGHRRLIGRAVAGGFAGAALGAIAFNLIGAGLFPLAGTGQPISTTWPTRLMARLLATVAPAVILMLLVPGSLPAPSRTES